MSQLNMALVTVGGLVLVVGLLSKLIRHSFISTPLIALLAGIMLGRPPSACSTPIVGVIRR